MTVAISPSTTQSVDESQSLNFTATLGNDAINQGVTWAVTGTGCTGNGCGTLMNPTTSAVTYVAPGSLTAAIAVTLTAKSVTNTAITATVTINVVLPPTFLTTTLPNGSNGVPYNQTILVAGGVAPLTFTTTDSLPDGLTLNPSGKIVGTPSGPAVNAKPLLSNFTVKATDNALVAITEPLSITVNPPPVLTISSNTLPTGTVGVNYSALIPVQGGVRPFTFSLVAPNNILPSGLSLNTTTGQIAGIPKAAASASSLNIQVTDSSISSIGPQVATGTLSITIQSPPPLSITTTSLPSGTTATPYNGSLQATGGIPPYTWSITTGLLPSGLTLASLQDGTGQISGTPILVTTSSFTVEVQDSEIVPVTAKRQFSIAIAAGAANNALFNHSYSFLFNGFDSGGSVAIAGSIAADGKGNIIAGTEDSNRSSGVVIGASLTGKYSIVSDGRGTLELVAVAGPRSLTTDYQLVLDSKGNARFFEDNSTTTNTDTSGTHGEGILKPVVGSGFAASSFSGNYAFEFAGQDLAGKPAALAGVVHADGTQNLSPGTCDFNDAGTFSPQLNLSGNFALGSGTRASAQMLFIPSTSQVTLHFTFYFVSPSDLYFIEVDSSPTTGLPVDFELSGEMILQNPTTSFDSKVLQGVSVVTGTGVNAGNASVFAGLLTAPLCDGQKPACLAYDENNGGTIATPTPAFTGTFTVATNGRVSFSLTGIGNPAPQPRVATAYLTGPGQGFLLGSDAAVTTGLFEQQSLGPSFALASLQGGYTLSAPLVAETQVKNVLGQVNADGSGGVLGTVDEIDPPATTAPNLKALTGTIDNGSLVSSGRGTMTTTAPVPVGFPTHLIFYVVSPGTIRLISADPGDQHPELILFDH